MTTSICIFCDNQLGPDTKPEHILLNGLGGRKTTRRVICSNCNNRFGGTIDDALTNQVEVIRNLLQLESGTGKPPPMLLNIAAGTEKVNFRSDGTPELVMPPFTVEELLDGRVRIQVAARSSEDLQRSLAHLARRLRIAEARVTELMTQGTGGVIEMRPGGVHHAISLGGEDAIRSIAKSCLVLLATVVGNEAVKSDAFSAVRKFVVSGGKEFNAARVHIDSRNVPNTDALQTEYGKFFNLIYVRSNSAGQVIGHFTLYNLIGWQIVLAEAGGPSGCEIGLVSNPLDPSAWSDTISDTLDIPFQWLDATDREYEVKRTRERLIGAMQHHRDQSLEAEIGRIVDDSFTKHGIKGEGEVVDPAKQRVIIGEIAARLAAHAMHLPYEETFSPDQLVGLFKPKVE